MMVLALLGLWHYMGKHNQKAHGRRRGPTSTAPFRIKGGKRRLGLG